MTTLQTRLAPTLLVAAVLLASCSQEEPRPAPRPVPASHHVSTTRQAPAPVQNKVSHTAPAGAETTEDVGESGQTEQTGIPACDDYLSSYIACHRAAHIFAPGQLPERYRAMREGLMRDSKNPDIRPQLAARCNSLARQLRDALHGKSCAVEPASGSSNP